MHVCKVGMDIQYCWVLSFNGLRQVYSIQPANKEISTNKEGSRYEQCDRESLFYSFVSFVPRLPIYLFSVLSINDNDASKIVLPLTTLCLCFVASLHSLIHV